MKKKAVLTGVGVLVLVWAVFFVLRHQENQDVGRDQETTGTLAESAPVDASIPPTLFQATPYVDYFNQKVREDYAIAKAAAVIPSSDFQWKKGVHKLIVKGREAGARLNQIWIGKVGETPEGQAGKIVEVEAGKLTPPMKEEKIGGKSVLIGAVNGAATYELEITEDGVYQLWGRACGPDASSDSFTVKVDDNPEFTWDVPSSKEGTTKWTRMAARGLDYHAQLGFWLSWGATSPLSKYRDDPELRRLALALSEYQLKALAMAKTSPKGLWFMRELEMVFMWQQDARVPRSVVDGLRAKILPYVEVCYKRIQSHEGWSENTPNIQIQSAAILRLASIMWKNEAPELSKEWERTSEDCLDRAWKYKWPGCGFVYSYGSGFDATYMGLDGGFLGRYYMLTGDERVKSALKDMAQSAMNTSTYGHPLSFGSPWWKHTFSRFNNGDDSIPEMILAVSEDPYYARVVELGRKRFFSRPVELRQSEPLNTYYNMLAPDIQVKIAPIKNRAFFSKIENGPALRFHSLNVAMPWRSWCESTCGAAYSTPEAVESEVASVILTAVTREGGQKIDKARYPDAYSIVEQVHPVPDARATIIGEDFIASATSFRPALGGPAVPGRVDKENLSPWRRTDIWFADRNGFAGALELSALQDNSCSKVALWIHVSDKLKIDGNAVKLKGLTVTTERETGGQIVNLGKIWGPPGGWYPLDLLESVLKESGPEGFKKGETFNASVAVNVDGSGGLSVGERRFEDGVYTVEILRDGEKYALLLYNSSLQEKRGVDAKPYRSVVRSKDATGDARTISSSKPIDLPPGSLTVLTAPQRLSQEIKRAQSRRLTIRSKNQTRQKIAGL